MSTLDMFWYKLPQKWGIVGINFGQKFQFSKVLLSPKFKNNSIIIEVKKKNFYYILYHTLEWNIDPIESKVKYVVEFFFFTAILIELCLNFGDNKTFENLKFLSKASANPTPFLG